MNHFYINIEGWFTFPKLYTSMVQKFDNAIFVEVGVWKGKSASYMTVEIINSNKKIQFFCIDTWKGSVEHQNFEEVKKDTLYNEFLENMKAVDGRYIPIRNNSQEAANQFNDESIDFIFIDASHLYEDVLSDIKKWFPKVKKGGIIAGHDYDWAGVKKAVGEFFADVPVKDEECCWIVEKIK